MIIGNIATIAKSQANMENGFYLVGLLAIFNAGGRLAAGLLAIALVIAFLTKPVSKTAKTDISHVEQAI